MLNRLKELNRNIPFYDIYSPKFAEYGRVIDNFDATQIIAEAKKIQNPESGSVYLPSVAEFEALDILKTARDEIFGTLDTQLGYCYGYNNMLGATEWHCSSELNIAVTPFVLILGKRSDIKNGKLNSADMKAFYVPAGAVIEVYATTLHFCPCQAADEGFGCVVGLPRTTNTPLDAPVSDPVQFRKNKWIMAHESNATLIERGVVSGIYGENYKINY